MLQVKGLDGLKLCETQRNSRCLVLAELPGVPVAGEPDIEFGLSGLSADSGKVDPFSRRSGSIP